MSNVLLLPSQIIVTLELDAHWKVVELGTPLAQCTECVSLLVCSLKSCADACTMVKKNLLGDPEEQTARSYCRRSGLAFNICVVGLVELGGAGGDKWKALPLIDDTDRDKPIAPTARTRDAWTPAAASSGVCGITSAGVVAVVTCNVVRMLDNSMERGLWPSTIPLTSS